MAGNNNNRRQNHNYNRNGRDSRRDVRDDVRDASGRRDRRDPIPTRASGRVIKTSRGARGAAQYEHGLEVMGLLDPIDLRDLKEFGRCGDELNVTNVDVFVPDSKNPSQVIGLIGYRTAKDLDAALSKNCYGVPDGHAFWGTTRVTVRPMPSNKGINDNKLSAEGDKTNHHSEAGEASQSRSRSRSRSRSGDRGGNRKHRRKRSRSASSDSSKSRSPSPPRKQHPPPAHPHPPPTAIVSYPHATTVYHQHGSTAPHQAYYYSAQNSNAVAPLPSVYAQMPVQATHDAGGGGGWAETAANLPAAADPHHAAAHHHALHHPATYPQPDGGTWAYAASSASAPAYAPHHHHQPANDNLAPTYSQPQHSHMHSGPQHLQ